MNKKLIFFLFCTLSAKSFALSLLPQEGTKVEVKAPYTFGTHEIQSSEIQGSVEYDLKKNTILSGLLKLPITSLLHDDKELQCHLQEALGLDYDRSDFPDDHVCDDKNRLPEEGKNSIVFSHISAEVLEPIPSGSSELPVKWTIHGVTKEIPTKIQSSWISESGRLILEGKITFKRKDFGIIVKKFLFVAVDEEIPVSFKIELGENK